MGLQNSNTLATIGIIFIGRLLLGSFTDLFTSFTTSIKTLLPKSLGRISTTQSMQDEHIKCALM